ncbi:hypothetical protein VM94_00886 [Janthinobacterium sp. KBS0711]|uniref:hypothetical protein n=1 Tax=Janthinobacterium sp. KBS0711 TaxID=1649647 RepID=UPI00062F97A7|nr:hypothetical protein [Janthinobacterium sp. KBS0711]KKO65351.1 hypothetical protein VM94_00886 [Janthinobacterium sp. KBS0711]TSD71185.1 hypothetical protein FFI39_009365 [Janthinobacterium sp. KBS0711]
MKIPNWLKIVWWLILSGGLTLFLYARLPDLLTGKAAAADVAVFGIWMALLFAPIFSEVTLLGVTLKNEIEELEEKITTQIGDVRTDIRNAIDVRTTVSPVFNMPAPPTDAQLPALEVQVKAAVAAAISEHKLQAAPAENSQISDDIVFLFQTRYGIEKELRRLAAVIGYELPPRRVVPLLSLTSVLVNHGVLDSKLGAAIREVTSICSPAIHGESVTDAQVAFVRDVAPGLLTALQNKDAFSTLTTLRPISP